jgi:hypothetical protein
MNYSPPKLHIKRNLTSTTGEIMKKLFTILTLSLAVSTLFISTSALAEIYGGGVQVTERTLVSAIISDPQAHMGKKIMVEGPIVEVCSTRGCWLELGSDKEFQTFRIKVEDGVMIFPMSAQGKYARVEGKVEDKGGALEANCTDKDRQKRLQLRASGAVID